MKSRQNLLASTAYARPSPFWIFLPFFWKNSLAFLCQSDSIMSLLFFFYPNYKKATGLFLFIVTPSPLRTFFFPPFLQAVYCHAFFSTFFCGQQIYGAIARSLMVLLPSPSVPGPLNFLAFLKRVFVSNQRPRRLTLGTSYPPHER